MQEEMFYARFGATVRYLRNRKGLTQATLAEALNLSRSSVANIEQGRQKVFVHQLPELVSALKISYPELLDPDSLEFGQESLKDTLKRVPKQHRDAVEAVLSTTTTKK